MTKDPPPMRLHRSLHPFLQTATCAFACFALLSAAAQTVPDWSVSPGATVRVDVNVRMLPDHKDLGVFVKIPDGGLLPGKYPTPDVRDSSGKPVESVIVGYNQADSLGVLFAAPDTGDAVHIFIKGSSTPPPKPEKRRLYPSVIFYTKNGGASLDAAKRMSEEYPPALGANFGSWTCIGSMVNPYGPDDDYNAWFVGALLLKKKETIYFATVSDEGSEFTIDGKTIASWPGIHTRDGGAKGQHGANVELSEGLHRIDYYQFEVRGKQEAQLTWRRKGVETKSGLPELVNEFAKSGDGTISAIVFKDGRRGATIRGTSEPNGYFWTGEKPLNFFTLAYSGIADENSTVTWEFGKHKRISEPIVEWLVPGDADTLSYPVTLAISNKAGIARTSARLVCPWTPSELSFDTANDRLTARKALYNMVRAVAKPGDPCADWNADQWSLLVDLLEPYRAGPILVEIFTRSFETIQKLPPEQRWALEDRFVETLRLQRNGKTLLDWIGKLEANEKTSARKFRWKEERVCADLFDLNDPAAARHDVAFLKEAAVAPDQTQVAALRQGDVERVLGDADGAMKFYKDAQERYRSRNKTGVAGGRLGFVDPKKRKAVVDTNEVSKVTSKKPKLPSMTSQKKVDDWKIYTVHDASIAATISAFLAQDAIPEAFQKLSDWENESPQSKLSGEFPLTEAKVYIHVEDYVRAINALSNFRKSVAMSAQLADAMKLETDCLTRIGEKARAQEVAKEFLKRFPGHPYEADMKGIATP